MRKVLEMMRLYQAATRGRRVLFLECGPTIPRDHGGKKPFEASWTVVITMVTSTDMDLVDLASLDLLALAWLHRAGGRPNLRILE